MTHKSGRRQVGTASRKGAATAFADYPRPSVAVDVVCLTVEDGALSVLLYERAIAPQRGAVALPGGFVQIDEALDAAAARLLRDKAGLRDVFIEQLHTFGDPRRDPRGRVITVAYVALLDAARVQGATALRCTVRAPAQAAHDGAVGPVEVVDGAGRRRELFLDHGEILAVAVHRLRAKLDDSPIGFQLLPRQFTLRALQDVHEAIRGAPVNKDSFRRRMLATGQLEPTGTRQAAVLHRPAELFRFVTRSAV